MRALLLSLALMLAGGALAGAGEKAPLERPIIAGLLSASDEYDGRRVVIYGLVIEAAPDGREFFLQDVSQIPLRIVGGQGLQAAAGDELLVTGTFVGGDGSPYLRAEALLPTKVLGGGGCC